MRVERSATCSFPGWSTRIRNRFDDSPAPAAVAVAVVVTIGRVVVCHWL